MICARSCGAPSAALPFATLSYILGSTTPSWNVGSYFPLDCTQRWLLASRRRKYGDEVTFEGQAYELRLR